MSELLAAGAGGSAAGRVSVHHPAAVTALRRLGEHLNWRDVIDLDYFRVDGRPQFIECKPRTVEPGNAHAADVNLPELLAAVATGDALPEVQRITRPGIRTRSTMAIGLGTAEQRRTRRAVAASIASAIARRPPLDDTTEVLTSAVRDRPAWSRLGELPLVNMDEPQAVCALPCRVVLVGEAIDDLSRGLDGSDGFQPLTCRPGVLPAPDVRRVGGVVALDRRCVGRVDAGRRQ